MWIQLINTLIITLSKSEQMDSRTKEKKNDCKGKKQQFSEQKSESCGEPQSPSSLKRTCYMEKETVYYSTLYINVFFILNSFFKETFLKINNEFFRNRENYFKSLFLFYLLKKNKHSIKMFCSPAKISTSIALRRCRGDIFVLLYNPHIYLYIYICNRQV